jgi:hypothetical protein
MPDVNETSGQQDMAGRSPVLVTSGQAAAVLSGSSDGITPLQPAGAGITNLPAITDGWKQVTSVYVNYPSVLTIRNETHPVVISREPGTLDMAYFHPDGSLWAVNRSGGYLVNWSPETEIDAYPSVIGSPGLFSWGPDTVSLMETDDSNRIWYYTWTQGVGWGGGSYLINNGDVNSTPVALTRGDCLELVYFNRTGNTIHVRHNITSDTWTSTIIDGTNQPGNIEGLSLVSTSPDSFTVIQHDSNFNLIYTKNWSQSHGWYLWQNTGISAYGYPASSVRSYTDTGVQNTTIDLVYNGTSLFPYYWAKSYDKGNTWTDIRSAGAYIGTPPGMASPHFNRLEMVDVNNGWIADTAWEGPDISRIGLFRNGFWILDANGNYQWDGTGSGKDIVAGFGTTGDKPVVGDWNGDGRSEIAVFRPSTGQWIVDLNGNYAWDGTGTGQDITASLGQNGDIPVAGDWKGVAFTRTGKDKIGVFRNGFWILDANGNYMWDGTGSYRDVVAGFGQAGDIPVVACWGGDGNGDKIGVFRNGFWILDLSGNYQWDGTPTDIVAGFGAAGDVPVPKDWNGDGKPEIAVFRPSTGQWIIDYNGNYAWDGTGAGQDVTVSLGQNGDTTVAGNWNVQDTDKLGVFRNGFWILDYNGNLAWDGPPKDKAAGFGTTGDVPVVGDWR